MIKNANSTKNFMIKNKEIFVYSVEATIGRPYKQICIKSWLNHNFNGRPCIEKIRSLKDLIFYDFRRASKAPPYSAEWISQPMRLLLCIISTAHISGLLLN